MILKSLKHFYRFFIFTLVVCFFNFVFLATAAEDEIDLSSIESSCVNENARVSLSWTSDLNSGFTYEVQRSIAGEDNFSVIFSDKNVFAYIDSNIISGKAYDYKIKAVKAEETYFSLERTSEISYCAPFLHNPTTSCDASAPQIDLTWNKATGDMKEYKVLRKRETDADYSTIKTINASSVVLNGEGQAIYTDDDNVIGGKKHNYKIEAVWMDDSTAISREITDFIGALCVADISLEMFCDEAKGSYSVLTWTKMAGAEEYKIYRKDSNESDFSLLVEGISGDATSYNDFFAESLEFDFIYDYKKNTVSYKIQTTWKDGQTDSAVESLDILDCNPVLELTGECPYGVSSDIAVNLDWSQNTGWLYLIKRAIDGQAETNIIDYFDNWDFSNAKSTTYRDILSTTICPGGVCPDMSYRVEIWTYSGNFLSQSMPITLDCTPKEIIEAPAITKLEPICDPVEGSTVKVSWIKPENSYAYTIYRDIDTAFPKTVYSGIAVDNYYDKNVEGEYTYDYMVTAWSSEGTYSVNSEIVPIRTINCSAPQTPGNLQFSNSCKPSKSLVNISWDGGGNVLSYFIYRGINQDNLKHVRTVEPNEAEFTSRSWQDSGLDLGMLSGNTTYYYKVVANGPSGVSSMSSTIESHTTETCLASYPVVAVERACDGESSIMNISWTSDDSSNTDYYKIFREDLTDPIYSSVDNTESSWTDTSVVKNIKYKYKIEAVDFLGDGVSSEYSEEIEAYNCGTPDDFVLSTVTQDCASGYPKANLNWTKSEWSDYYNITRYKKNTDFDIDFEYKNITDLFLEDRGMGNSLSFIGDDDLVTVPQSDSLKMSDSFSIEVWAKANELKSGHRRIIEKGNDGGDGFSLRSLDDGTFEFSVHKYNQIYATNYNAASNNSYDVGTWVHLVGIYDKSIPAVKLYINGVEQTKSTDTEILARTTEDIRFGTIPRYIYKRFFGEIDEARIYARALAPTEIAEHYNGVFTNNSELRALWHFDEGSGSYIYDNSENNNIGTLGCDNTDPLCGPDWTKNGIQYNEEYKWKVEGVNNAGITTEKESNIITANNYCFPVKPGLYAKATCKEAYIPTVDLTWPNSFDATEYDIWRKKQGEDFIKIQDNLLTFGKWTDEDSALLLEENYTYYITASGNGLDTNSSEVAVTTLSCEPPSAPPSNILVTSGCNGSYPKVDISWDAVDGVDHYVVYWDKDGIDIGEDPIDVSGNLTKTSFTHTHSSSTDVLSIEVNNDYHYIIESVASNDLKKTSEAVETHVDYCPLSIPSGLELSPSCNDSNAKMKIFWTDESPFNTKKYEVYMVGTENPVYSLDNPNSMSQAFEEYSWIDNNLENSALYEYYVKFVDKDDKFSVSSLVGKETFSCVDMSEIPTIDAYVECVDNEPKIRVDWTSPNKDIGYNIYRKNETTGVLSAYANVKEQEAPEIPSLNNHDNYVLSFDGRDDCAVTPTLPRDKFTFTTWVYRNEDSTSSQTLLMNGRAYRFFIFKHSNGQFLSNTNAEPILFSIVGNRLAALTGSVPIQRDYYYKPIYGYSDVVLPLASWHHVACTYDGSKITMYQDGENVGSVDFVQGNNYLGNTYFGGFFEGSYYMHGSVVRYYSPVRSYALAKVKFDEMRYYNDILSDLDIKNQANGVYNDSDERLVAGWHFNEDNGKVALDFTKNGYNAGLYANAYADSYLIYKGKSVILYTHSLASGEGSDMRALIEEYSNIKEPVGHIDNGEHYIKMAPNKGLSMGDNEDFNIEGSMSIELWIKANEINPDVNRYNNIIYYRGSNNDIGYSLMAFKYSGDINQMYKFAFQNKQFDASKNVISAGTIGDDWYHVVGVFDAYENKIKLYVNGVLSEQEYNEVVSASGVGLYIGRHYLGAEIDNVKLYARALDSREVLDHYNGTFKNNSELRGAWNFNEGKGQVVYDSSKNNNNGFVGTSYYEDSYDTEWISGVKRDIIGSDDSYVLYDVESPQLGNTYTYSIKGFANGEISDYSNTDTVVYNNPCLDFSDIFSKYTCDSYYNSSNIIAWKREENIDQYELMKDGEVESSYEEDDDGYINHWMTLASMGIGGSSNDLCIYHAYYAHAHHSVGLFPNYNNCIRISDIAPMPGDKHRSYEWTDTFRKNISSGASSIKYAFAYIYSDRDKYVSLETPGANHGSASLEVFLNGTPVAWYRDCTLTTSCVKRLDLTKKLFLNKGINRFLIKVVSANVSVRLVDGSNQITSNALEYITTWASDDEADYSLNYISDSGSNIIDIPEDVESTCNLPEISLQVEPDCGDTTPAFTLSWSADINDLIDSWSIRRKKPSEEWTAESEIENNAYTSSYYRLEGDVNYFTDNTVDGETEYDYWVVGNGAAADTDLGTISDTSQSLAFCASAPEIPVLSIDSNTCNGFNPEIAINWTEDSGNAEHYDVFRKKSTDADFSKIDSVDFNGGSNYSYSDSDLELDQLYYYRVDAVAGIYSQASNVLEVTTIDCLKSRPQEFDIIDIKATAKALDLYTTIRWERTNATKYDVYRVKDNQYKDLGDVIKKGTIIGTINNDDLADGDTVVSLKDETVKDIETYYYAVRAINENVEVGINYRDSSEKSIFVPCATPGDFTLNHEWVDNKAYLSWNEPVARDDYGDILYDVEKSSQPDFSDAESIFTGLTILEVTDEDVSFNDGEIYYRVRAHNINGCGIYSSDSGANTIDMIPTWREVPPGN